MTTGATGQLGLALPVQGELSGTWGDTVNNGITQYTNIAIAATLTLTNDGAVTLANTTGDATASNITSSLTGAGTVTAQFAIVRVTGTLTTAKVITAPSYSKTYVVVNAATGGIVTFKASGQTGVSIAVGESAWVYYNGTDYVKIAGTTSGSAGGSNTQVQYNSSGALAGSSNLTFDGTSLTLGGNPTLSAGTANGVTYLNGSKVLTSGSALTFDGSSLAVAGFIRSSNYTPVPTTGAGGELYYVPAQTTTYLNSYDRAGGTYKTLALSGSTISLQIGGSEAALLNASGNLGLGVTPSAWGSIFDAVQIGNYGAFIAGRSDGSNQVHIGANAYFNGTNWIYANTSAASRYFQSSGVHYWETAASGTAGNAITFTQAMTLDADGDLGIGTTTVDSRLRVLDAAGNGLRIGYLSGSLNYNLYDASVHQFRNPNGVTNYATLDATGLGLGTSSPSEKLQIDSGNIRLQGTNPGQILFFSTGNGISQNATLAVQNDGSTTNTGEFRFSTRNSGGTLAERARIFATGGFSVGTTADPGAGAIYATGNITAYYSSDIKFKENVRDIPNALATVNAIGGKLFDWTDEYIESKGGADGYFVQKADFGVVAQDVQKVFPIAVRTRQDGSLAVDYEKLGALAMAALTELTKRVEALEAK